MTTPDNIYPRVKADAQALLTSLIDTYRDGVPTGPDVFRELARQLQRFVDDHGPGLLLAEMDQETARRLLAYGRERYPVEMMALLTGDPNSQLGARLPKSEAHGQVMHVVTLWMESYATGLDDPPIHDSVMEHYTRVQAAFLDQGGDRERGYRRIFTASRDLLIEAAYRPENLMAIVPEES